MNRKILFASLLALPLVLNAAPTSSKINLTGGTILPKKYIEVSFAELTDGVFYEVLCDEVTSDNKANQDYDYIKFYSNDDYVRVSLNGEILDFDQGKISTHKINKFKIYRVNKNLANNIIIRNLDDTDTLTVKQCYAVPVGK